MVISQETLTKSNEVFATFKKEMEKVQPMSTDVMQWKKFLLDTVVSFVLNSILESGHYDHHSVLTFASFIINDLPYTDSHVLLDSLTIVFWADVQNYQEIREREFDSQKEDRKIRCLHQ